MGGSESLGGLGQGTHGFGRKFQFHATYTFGLDVYLECPASMTLGVTDFVACFGATTSQITGSAHRIAFILLARNTAPSTVDGLNSYRKESIMERLSWQESNFFSSSKLSNKLSN